jgi:hypothetical protein
MNKLGFTELVDTCADVIRTTRTIGGALADGFQITDLSAMLTIAPNVQELVRDGKQAIAELVDLTPQEAGLAKAQIAAITGLPNDDTVWGKVNHGLDLLVQTYRTVDDAYDLFQDWASFARSFSA